MIAHLDTHVAVWLRMGDKRRLRPIKRTLDHSQLVLSPFVLLELQTLFEIGRLRETGRWILKSLGEDHGVELATAGLDRAAERAVDLTFTRDPFDRLIAAHALAASAVLLSADGELLRHVSCAQWG